MNYKNHYDKLIARAKDRELIGYSEKHHIIPKCIGGTNDNDNIIKLTAEEHYVAHQLLVKIYPDNVKLKYALHTMSIGPRGQRSNNKRFGWIRKQNALATKTFHKGRTRSEETKKRISEALKGKPRKGVKGVNLGFKHSEETLRKRSLKLRGQKRTQEQIENNRRAQIGLQSGEKNPRARTIKFISPNGEEFIVHGGFIKFCKNNNLPISTIMNFLNKSIPIGQNSKAYGWHIEYM
jgi:hypothetical protein